jgi:hypothetical protein
MSAGNETFDPYLSWLGLNLRERPLDHYSLLGLECFEGNAAVIEQRADERLRLVRSFQTGPRGRFTHKLLNELTAAKLCLLSPAAKRTYDEQLQRWNQRAADRLTERSKMPTGVMPEVGSDAELIGGPATLLPPTAADASSTFQTNSGAAKESEADDTESQSVGVSAPMLIVGLVFGMIGIGIVCWTIALFATQRGWLAGGPPAGGPPPPVGAQKSGVAESSAGGSVSTDDEPGSDVAVTDAADQPIEVLQESSGDVLLSPATAAPVGQVTVDLEGTEEVLSGWQGPADAARWRFRVVKPGEFQLQVTYAAGDEAFGRKLQMTIDGREQFLELQPTRNRFRTDSLSVDVTEGTHELRMAPTSAFQGELRIKLVRLLAATDESKTKDTKTTENE